MFKSYEQTEHIEQYIYERMNDLLSTAPIMGQKNCQNKQEILQTHGNDFFVLRICFKKQLN